MIERRYTVSYTDHGGDYQVTDPMSYKRAFRHAMMMWHVHKLEACINLALIQGKDPRNDAR